MEELLANSQPTQTTFVYDRRTGEVVHVHQFVPFTKENRCPTDEMGRTAMELAPTEAQRDALDLLHVDGELTLSPESRYRVDIERKVLVEERASTTPLRGY